MADITRPAVPARPPGPRGAGGGWQAAVYRGGHPYQARPSTIQVVKERIEGPHALLAFEFEDTEGRAWRYVYGAVRQADGTWKAAGGAGGGGAGDPKLEHGHPWANFGGWGWPCFLALGGWVHGHQVAGVRLIDAGGKVVEDSVDQGVALLWNGEAMEMPCVLELRDGEGHVLRTQEWPPSAGERHRR